MNLKSIHTNHLSLQLQAINHQFKHQRQMQHMHYNLALAGYMQMQSQLLLKNEFAMVALLDEIIRDVQCLKAANCLWN